MTAVFKRAERDALGNIYLKANQLYFFDTPVEKVFPESGEIIEGLPYTSMKDILTDFRGNMLVSVLPENDIKVSREVTPRTGHFFEIAPETALSDVQHELYGEAFDKNFSAWEYIGQKSPALLELMKNTAEVIAEYTQPLRDSVKNDFVKPLMIGLGIVLGLALLSKLKK